MAVDHIEKQVAVDGGDANEQEVVLRMRREMEGEGWTFSYQKPALSQDGAQIDGAVVLCFWRTDEISPTGDRAAHDSLATTPERPENWTKA